MNEEGRVLSMEEHERNIAFSVEGLFPKQLAGPSDEALRQTLAKILPDRLGSYCSIEDCNQAGESVPWRYRWPSGALGENLHSMELLELCHEAEQRLDTGELKTAYIHALRELVLPDAWQVLPLDVVMWFMVHATWQQRVQAAAAVRNITIETI